MSINVKKTLLKAKNLAKNNDIAGAEQLYNQVLEKFPANREATKRLSDLRNSRSTGIQLESGPFQQKIEKVIHLYNRGHLQQATLQGRKLASEYPGEALVYNLIGAAETGLGNYKSALESLHEAIRLVPEYAEAFNNLGAAYNMMGRSAEAVSCYTRVLELQPAFAEAYSNRANALKKMGDSEAALSDYRKAVQIQPAFADAHYNMGALLGHMSRFEEGIDSCSLALQIDPQLAMARAARLFQQAKICDWKGIEADAAYLPDLGTHNGYVSPFSLLSFEDSPEQELIRAQRFANKHYRIDELGPFSPPEKKVDRIRIGYFSADFHNHATMYLMAGLFENHDSEKFVVHAYSYGKVQNDEMGVRLKSAVSVFHDVWDRSDQEIAQLARSEGIDIAVDLKGYTQEARLGVFAYRAAPVQISYLGYPGTLGASFMDYIVADPVVVPSQYRENYTEKLIWLPNSYQVNDRERSISGGKVSRLDAGLPEDAFVFCCFNNCYKIGPNEFDIWMRLLERKEKSVLWLLKSNSIAVEALRAEAKARGIQSGRIVFADPLPHQEHLSRLQLADLFLDTFNYNAHTSASDALWAGVPVVTKLGESFSARVAASLLGAVDLSELVTASEHKYEDLAFALAAHPDQLAALKSRLAKNRLEAPLFDTKLFAEHIERGYEQAHLKYLEGDKPSDIMVDL